MAIGPDY
jgi:hypothetical protein